MLDQRCRERLAGYKVPARFRLIAALPRTPSGKRAKAWVWKAGFVPVRELNQRGPEALSMPARPSRHAVDSAKYGRVS